MFGKKRRIEANLRDLLKENAAERYVNGLSKRDVSQRLDELSVKLDALMKRLDDGV